MAETAPAETGIKGTTAVVSDLMPGTTYRVQVSVSGYRDRDDDKPGVVRNPWSPAVEFTTVEDTVAPAAPSNLVAVIDDGMFRLEWTAPTQNEDGSPLGSTNDFRDYVVEALLGDNLVQRFSVPYAGLESTDVDKDVYIVPVPARELIYADVAAAGDVIVTFRVYSRDLGWNTSTDYSQDEVLIGAPNMPVGFESEGGQLAVTLRWYPPNDDEPSVSHYEIYSSPNQSELLSGGGQFETSFSGPLPPRDYSEGVPQDYSRYSISIRPASRNALFYKIIAINLLGMASEPAVTTSAVEASPPINDEDITLSPLAPIVVGGHYGFEVEADISNIAVEDVPNLAYIEIWARQLDLAVPEEPTAPLGTLTVTKSEDGSYKNPSSWFTFIIQGATDEAQVEVWTAPVNSAGRAGTSDPSDVDPRSPSTVTTVTRVEGEHISRLSITDAHIQTINASKLMADTAINKNLFVKSTLTIQEGGLLRSSNYTPSTSGWAIESSGYAELNNVRIRGVVEATSGFLDGLNVRNTITVGDGGLAGTIRSSAALADGGWEINSDGGAILNSAIVRGRVEADSGYLSGLTVNGNLIMSNSAAYIGTSFLSTTDGGWRIYGDGSARFYDVTLRNLVGIGGYLQNLNVRGTITVGEGSIAGTLRSSTYSLSSASHGWEFNSDGTLTINNGEIQLGSRITLNEDGIFGTDFAISAHTGRAEFTDGYFRGELHAEEGTFAGSLTAADGSFVGTIMTDYADNPSSGNKILIDGTDFLRVYGANSPASWTNNVYWRVLTTEQDNFLIEAAPGIYSSYEAYQGLAVRTRYSNYLQLHAFDAYSTPIYWSLRVGRGGTSRSDDWSIGDNAGRMSVYSNRFLFGNGGDWSPSAADGIIYAGGFRTGGIYSVDHGMSNYISSGTQSGQVSITASGTEAAVFGSGGVFLKTVPYSSSAASNYHGIYQTPGGFLYRSASSISTKRNVVTMEEEQYPYSILDVEPMAFEGSGPEPDGTIVFGNRQFGLVAEQVHEAFPRATIYDDGKPSGISWEQVNTALLYEVQKLSRRVEQLEAALSQ